MPLWGVRTVREDHHDVNPPDASHLPPGRQPYDPLVGFRVGAIAGGILGVILVAISSLASFWVVLVAAAIGGAIGYWTEKFKLSGEDRD